MIAALPLPWPFEREFMQLALVAGVVVGACAPLIGAFLVEKRMSLLGDGIGHLAFAGVAAGLLLGIWPVWAALVVALCGAIAVDRVRARGRTGGDLGLAIMFYAGIGGAVVLLSLGRSFNANLFSYLFGSILTVDRGDVWVVVLLGAVILAAVATVGRALFATVHDEDWSRVAGIRVDALNTALTVLAAVTVVAGMRVVGILLVAALMIVPVASAQLLAGSLRGTLVISSALGVASVVAGLVAARQWSLAPGGSVVLVAVGVFLVASVGSRKGKRGSSRRRPAVPELPAG